VLKAITAGLIHVQKLLQQVYDMFSVVAITASNDERTHHAPQSKKFKKSYVRIRISQRFFLSLWLEMKMIGVGGSTRFAGVDGDYYRSYIISFI
jgi:hypothetical protein